MAGVFCPSLALPPPATYTHAHETSPPTDHHESAKNVGTVGHVVFIVSEKSHFLHSTPLVIDSIRRRKGVDSRVRKGTLPLVLVVDKALELLADVAEGSQL